MSKAFTRESDEAPEPPIRPRPRPVSLSGMKNYLTEDGAETLRAELSQLLQEIPSSPGEPRRLEKSRPGMSKRDERIAQIQEILNSAIVVAPPATPYDRVRFGATVLIRNQSGEEARYRIVGVDETDLDRNWISWQSPLAKALLNAQVGQHVRVRLPGGEEGWEIRALGHE